MKNEYKAWQTFSPCLKNVTSALELWACILLCCCLYHYIDLSGSLECLIEQGGHLSISLTCCLFHSLLPHSKQAWRNIRLRTPANLTNWAKWKTPWSHWTFDMCSTVEQYTAVHVRLGSCSSNMKQMRSLAQQLQGAAQICIIWLLWY